MFSYSSDYLNIIAEMREKDLIFSMSMDVLSIVDLTIIHYQKRRLGENIEKCVFCPLSIGDTFFVVKLSFTVLRGIKLKKNIGR